jgi:nicotinamidase-related amidase
MNTMRVGQPATSIASTSPMTRLRRERAVLLVIDLQEKLLPAIFEKERVLRNTLLLAQAARVLELPILLTTQYREGLGDLVPEIRETMPGVPAIDKISFGCFGCEAIVEWFVQRPGRDQLLVAGIESHVCVVQTVVAALERGLSVHVAADAVGSRSDANARAGLARMERAGAVVSSVEMAVFEMLDRADDEAFKTLLPLLK